MFMVQLSDIYITIFKYLLRKNSCLISLLTVKVPAAKTDLLGRLWPAASLCYMVTKELVWSRGWTYSCGASDLCKIKC